MLVLLCSCASTQRDLAAEPEHSQEEAFFAFPIPVAEKVSKAVKPDSDVSKVKEILCNGSVPRVNPKASFVVKYPDTKGMVLSDAAELKERHMQLIRDFLKYHYFAAISGEVDQGEEYQEFVSVFGKPKYASDLALLRATYTFKIPRPTLERLFKAWGDLNAVYWGWRYETGQWSSRLALENSPFMWTKYLANQTELTESPQSDQGIRFDILLRLDLWCAHGIAATDLISR